MSYTKGRLAFCISNNHHMTPTSFEWKFHQMLKPADTLRVHGGCSVKSSSINEALKNAMKAGAEWMFLMDVDQTFPSFTIPRLLETARKHEAKIVSVIYHLGTPPHSPVAGWSKKNEEGTWEPVNAENNDWREQYAFPDSGVVDVDWVGSGGLLIHRDVLEKMRPGWADEDPVVVDGKESEPETDWFRDTWVTGHHIRTLGHDVNFCTEAKELGYKVLVDTAVQSAHGKMTYFDTTYAKAYNSQHMGQAKEEILHKEALTKDYWDVVHLEERLKGLDFRARTLAKTYEEISSIVPEGALVADVGCGRGTLMKVLQDQKNATCVGYDISEEAIKDVRRGKFEGHVMDFRLFNTPDFSLNGESEKFDVVVASHIIEHIEGDSKFVKNLIAMTKKGGKVIIATPHLKEIQQCVEHVRGYDDTEMLEFMKEHFDDVEIRKTHRDFIAIGVVAAPLELATAKKPVELSVKS